MATTRFVVVHSSYLPRGKSVHVLYDLTRPGLNAYAVTEALESKTYLCTTGLTYSEARYLCDEAESLPGPGGDSGWLAVLARLTGKVERPGRWEGSVGEYASRFYPVGTWEWVQTLIKHRAIKGCRLNAA